MKIIGFSQQRNELSKGNIKNWFKSMGSICDYIYIYDQNSVDGSLEYYSKFDNTSVISSSVNRFGEEMICKQELLSKVQAEHPDADFILALDGDALMDGRLLKDNGKPFRDLCETLKGEKFDAYAFGFKNMWRSDTYWRNDSDYNGLDGSGVCSLWRFKLDLKFETRAGLHIRTFPVNMRTNRRLGDYKIVHRGFCTDYQIITKYELYRSLGQKGYALNRLLDERTLQVVRIDPELLPDWLEITDDVNPITKRRLIDIYNERK